MVWTSHIFIVATLACFMLTLGSNATRIKVCPAEPVAAQPFVCPSVCDYCEDVNPLVKRCVILDPDTDITLPDNIPSVVRCLGGFCDQIVVRCSNYASCDVDCGDYACGGLKLVCGASNYSCSAFCSKRSDPIGDFVCNNSFACRCENNCEIAPCQAAVTCPGDPCYGFWYAEEACYPYRHTARDLTFTKASPTSCTCACKNSSLVAVDVTLPDFNQVRYCRDPSAICSDSSQCGHGECIYGACECWNGWAQPTCVARLPECPMCENGGVCDSDNGKCTCTGGYSGPTCEIAPSCELNLTVAASCPVGCDECIGNHTCIVHNKKQDLSFGCPEAANDMRCVLICDTTSCYPDLMECTSTVACDFICAPPGDCYDARLRCSNPGVPCRATCTSPFPDYNVVGSFECAELSTNSSCPNCIADTCFPTATCAVGVDCPGDPCANFICQDGLTTYNETTFECKCHCPETLLKVNTSAASFFCYETLATFNCTCDDPRGICTADGKCICTGDRTGETCSDTISTCLAPTFAATGTTCPNECSYCDEAAHTCFFVNPLYSVSCPTGWKCVFECFEHQCNGIEIACFDGSGPCELFCFGDRSCLMATMFCETAQPCHAHCTSNDTLKDQVLADFLCFPDSQGSDSCSCHTNCRLQADVQNPCYLSSPQYDWYALDVLGEEVMTSLKTCWPTDSLGRPIELQRGNNSCSCECTDTTLKYNSLDELCQPVCDPVCNNRGQCIAVTDPVTNVVTRKCRCYGYSGKSCDFRCRIEGIPDEQIVGCEDGFYELTGNVSVTTKISIPDSNPDLRVIEVAGNIELSSNASISVASSNKTNLLTVNVTQDMKLTSGSTLITSGVLNGSTLVGPNVVVGGVATLAGQIVIVLDDAVIDDLLANGGTKTLSVLRYGNAIGQFSDIQIQSSFASSCAVVKQTPVYERTQLSIVFSVDTSACSKTPPGSSSDSSPSGANFSNNEANVTGIVAGTVVGGIIVLGAVAVILVMKVPTLKQKVFPRSNRLQVDADSDADTGMHANAQHQAVEMQQSTPSSRMHSNSNWTRATKPGFH